jgi:hypothetical protein
MSPELEQEYRSKDKSELQSAECKKVDDEQWSVVVGCD